EVYAGARGWLGKHVSFQGEERGATADEILAPIEGDILQSDAVNQLAADRQHNQGSHQLGRATEKIIQLTNLCRLCVTKSPASTRCSSRRRECDAIESGYGRQRRDCRGEGRVHSHSTPECSSASQRDTHQRVLPPVLRLTLRDGAELVTLRSAPSRRVRRSTGGSTRWLAPGG